MSKPRNKAILQMLLQFYEIILKETHDRTRRNIRRNCRQIRKMLKGAKNENN